MAGNADNTGRADRLSQALRANLRRRKATGGPADPAGGAAADNDAALQRRSDPLAPRGGEAARRPDEKGD